MLLSVCFSPSPIFFLNPVNQGRRKPTWSSILLEVFKESFSLSLSLSTEQNVEKHIEVVVIQLYINKKGRELNCIFILD